MKCEKCGNEDARYFYQGSKGWYCRKCVRFCDEGVKEDDEIKEVDSEYLLPFDLTDKQTKISNQLAQYVNQGHSCLVDAVCGAGKTEILVETIAQQLGKNKRVGFAIARRQVVLEIAKRMKLIFKKLKVIPVCEGFTQDINGDLIVCTTHQLYRYRHYFDLLIIDEPDAFPYKGNETLKGIALNSCNGPIVYLTATPDKYLLDMVKEGKLKQLCLNRRPHNHDLCVPKVEYGSNLKLFIKGYIWLNEQLLIGKKVIIFVPTKKIGRQLYLIMKNFYNCCHIDSESEDKDKVIKDFRADKYDICICTTVLERGVTISRVNVMIIFADHHVFDEASLIQSSGRVGRTLKDPSGECLFLCSKKEESIDNCIAMIQKANRNG